MRPRSASGEAFTLVEVLATLVLVALILPVALRGISLCLATAGHARNQLEAVALAEAKLAELVSTNGWRDADLEGDFGDDRGPYAWAADVNDRDENGVRELTVIVTWSARNRERSVALTTLVEDAGGVE
jgi:type II secretory pathway pseudopilin PulG